LWGGVGNPPPFAKVAAKMRMLILLMFLAALLVPVVIVGMILENKKKRSGMSPEEMQLVQDIHADLARMQERIEALETILIEKVKAR
jgi:phage shock protein B